METRSTLPRARLDGKVGGIAVHIGARVAALAAPDEILVSSTVKGLVAGSGLLFAARGAAALKRQLVRPVFRLLIEGSQAQWEAA